MESQLPFLSTLKELFFTEMDQQTSACLFGSAVAGDWVAGRSDLDMFVVVPEKGIELFGEKIKMWKSNPEHPTVDGFVLYSSGVTTMAREFHKFEKAVRLTEKFIPIIDLWNIKNRSVHLFGQDVKSFVREISNEELRDWAIKDIQGHWIPMISDLESRASISLDAKIPLTPVVWMASGVARMLMLSRGNVCASKREALLWLADECVEIRETINQLIEEFEKTDVTAIEFTARQTFALGRVYLRLLREVRR